MSIDFQTRANYARLDRQIGRFVPVHGPRHTPDFVLLLVRTQDHNVWISEDVATSFGMAISMFEQRAPFGNVTMLHLNRAAMRALKLRVQQFYRGDEAAKSIYRQLVQVTDYQDLTL